MGVKVRQRKGAWWLFIDHDKKRKAKRVGEGPTGKRAAEAAAVQLRARLAAGDRAILTPAARVPTFADYSRQWLDGVASVRCQASTRDLYETTRRVRLVPACGNLPLDQITRERVRAFIAQAHAQKLKPNTIRRGLSLLATILNTAVDDGVIPTNTAARQGRIVNAQQIQADDVDVFGADELVKLLDAAQADQHGTPLYPFVLTLARTGMRIGEAIALEWQDVDLERRIIAVRRTISGHSGRTSVPKSGKARRVDMSRQLLDVLHSSRSLQAAEAAVAGREAPLRVFQAIKGGPINVTSFRENEWARFLRTAGLRYRRPHVLRHTFASLLLAAGEPPTYVAQQLGHHSAAFTLKVYGHAMPQGDRRAVDALDTATNATVRNPGATATIGG